MSEMYEDEDSRTIFCANLSDKVTESLLFELFLQGGPLEKVSLPKDKDGHQRSFGFITYVHAISVPYAVSLFQGTRLFNRELTIKPRNSNNSTTQQRPVVPVIQQQLLQAIQNPFVMNPFPTNDINREHTQQHPSFPNRQSIEPSSLRTGFHQISTKASMIPQPSRPNNRLDPNSIASIASLLSMGANMMQSNNRPSFDIRHADRERSNNFKATQHNRPHHQDLPYKRRGSSPPRRDVTPRRQHGSGNVRHHGSGSNRHHGSGSDRRRR